MSNPFPKALQEHFRREVDYIKSRAQSSLYTDEAVITGLASAFKDRSYGFEDNLKTGNFAPYEHEHKEQSIHNHNCMSLIPSLYTMFDAWGFSPEIVEFSGFSNPADKDASPSDVPHVCVIINMKDGVQHIVDPFHSLWGKIKSFGDGKLVTSGNYESRKSKTRVYESVRGLDAEEFALMFEELRDEGKSLDVLLEGQKFGIHSKSYLGHDTDSMMIFLPEQNAILSRLYLGMEIFSDSFVEATSSFNAVGQRTGVAYQVGFAKGLGWLDMRGRVDIARFSSGTHRTLVQLLSGAVKNAERIGDMHRETELMDVHPEIIMQDLSPNALARIRMRTVYELTDRSEEYLYSEEERDKMLRDAGEEALRIRTDMRLLYNDILRHRWKIVPKDNNAKRRIKREDKKLEKEIEPLDDKIVALRSVQKKDEKRYNRMMDLLLFAEENKGTFEGMYDALENEGYDSRIGHLAMVGDFLPLMRARMHELKFDRHLNVLSGKIAARAQS